ncbi:MAG: MoxR family ATPase [Caldisericia bacterium]|nr:MoxR family ATPase [Caldisericia bacterium]
MNDKINLLIKNISKVIVGKDEAIKKAIITLISGGHLLIEDVPGVGKTMLAKSIAKSINLDFKRIQFTPDLLPSDIIGITVYNEKTKEFEFKKGPIFSNIILADEINRSTPKTQSALLEAMEERQVTVDGITYPLNEPFFVIATENPIEYEGTFPLPEAQLDRFFMKIEIGYPNKEDEILLLSRVQLKHPIEDLEEVIKKEEIVEIQKEVKKVYIDESLKEYIVNLGKELREDDDIYLGPSPRSLIILMRVSQGKAYIEGRDFVVPDDIKSLFESVMSHRIILKPESKLKGITEKEVIERAIQRVEVPIV